LKHFFLIVALLFGFFFTSCTKQEKTSTEVKLANEQIVHTNSDYLKNKAKAPLVTREDSIRKLYAIIFRNYLNHSQ
jgi:hypothetical protein